MHFALPQTTKDNLVEGRVGPAGQEAVQLVAVIQRQHSVPTSVWTRAGRTGVIYSRSDSWAPCGDHCCVLYQCLSFQCSWFELGVANFPAYVLCLWSVCHRVSIRPHSAVCYSFLRTMSIPILAVLSGAGRGSESWSPVEISERSGRAGNSSREGANELCQAEGHFPEMFAN